MTGVCPVFREAILNQSSLPNKLLFFWTTYCANQSIFYEGKKKKEKEKSKILPGLPERCQWGR
jgi:hypothetical protein